MNAPNDLRPRGDRHSTVDPGDHKEAEDELDMFLKIVGTEYVEEPPSDFGDDDFDDFDFGDDGCDCRC